MRNNYNSSKRGLKRFVALGSLTFLFSFSLKAQYCASSPTYTFDSEIDEVVLVGSGNSINNNTASTCAGYSDFTAQSVDVVAGSNYTVSVTLGTCGGNYDKYAKVFIDFNQDGDFSDAGEELGSIGPILSPAQGSIAFQVPIGATVGATRMRVVCSEESAASYVYSCGTYYYGETEDYTVNIIQPVLDDAALSAIVNPTTSCNGTIEAVEVDIYNSGINTINNLYVYYTVNSGTVYGDTLTNLGLTSGGSYTHTFTDSSDLSTSGNYVITSWVSYSLDQFSANDTTSVSIDILDGINQFPYQEDFEDGPQEYISGGTNSSWEFGNPSNTIISEAASGDSAWVTSLTGDYNISEDSWVQSPCFNLSSYTVDPSLRFSLVANAEEFYDGMHIEYSTNAGQTWSILGSATTGTTNWYNDTYYQWWSDNIGTGSNWVDAEHVLTGLAGETSVMLRWVFESDGWVSYEGIGFDDVTISDYPEFSFGSDDTLCVDTLFDFGFDPFANEFNWEVNGESVSNENTFLYSDTTLQTVTLRLEVTNSVGFSNFDEVVYYYVPPASLPADMAICDGESVDLDVSFSNPTNAQTAMAYLWNDGSTNDYLNVTSSGLYSVTATDSVSGCNTVDSVYITVNPTPDVNLGNDTSICENEFLVLNPGDWESYSWNNGASNSGIVVADTSGIYQVEVIDINGCVGTDDLSLTINLNPVVDLGADTVIGAYSLMTYTVASGYSSYLWSTADTTPSTTFIISNNQYLSVSVTDANGCVGDDEILIQVLLGTDGAESNKEMNLYPNPASQQVYLDLAGFNGNEVDVTLIDLTGRVVYQTVTNSLSTPINIPVEHLTNGVYTVVVKADNKVIGQKKVVKN